MLKNDVSGKSPKTPNPNQTATPKEVKWSLLWRSLWMGCFIQWFYLPFVSENALEKLLSQSSVQLCVVGCCAASEVTELQFFWIQFTAASTHTYCKGPTCPCHSQFDFALTRKRTEYIVWNSCQQQPLFLELVFELPFSVLQQVTLFHVNEFAGKCVLFVVVTGCCWAVTRWESAPW